MLNPSATRRQVVRSPPPFGREKVTLQTEKLVIPNYTTKNWLTMYIRCMAAGEGSVTMRVRRAQMIKRYDV